MLDWVADTWVTGSDYWLSSNMSVWAKLFDFDLRLWRPDGVMLATEALLPYSRGVGRGQTPGAADAGALTLLPPPTCFALTPGHEAARGLEDMWLLAMD